MLLRIFIIISVFASQSFAEIRTNSPERLFGMIKSELSRTYPLAKVDLTTQVRWTRGGMPSDLTRIRIVNENGRGGLQFEAIGTSSEGEVSSEGSVGYSLWVPARVALRRIQPGEKLSSDLFVNQEINVATGANYEYRGVVLDSSADVSTTESRQTILEGQTLLSTAIQRIPDLRRGEIVKIRINSGGLILTTMGTAEEPAFVSSRVRVMTSKNKRELSGQLLPDGVVEVSL